MHRDPFSQAELQQMVEAEHLRLELQMVETERVRLSLLEEKLVDVLQLLQRLRDLVGTRGILEERGCWGSQSKVMVRQAKERV